MKLKITEDKENPLLERRELTVKITYEKSPPTRKDFRSKLIAELNLDKDTVIVDKMEQKFGTREMVAFVKVYKTKERMLEIEDESKIKKNFEEEKEESS
ncbi:MAG: 30S ribosomal protein S24e [Candidatus Hydrothermarchaeota archaeon]|nr:MAG: 30S ribosomal protein S24e [Candidatus Hydrothermarchaeota archaeon]